MRVLIACDWFLKNAVPQAVSLADEGAEVALLCRSHALEFGGSDAERRGLLTELNGVSVHVLSGRVTSVESVGGVRSLRRTVSAWSPDVVHAHDNADPRLLAIVAGTRRVVTVHDPVPHPGQPPLNLVERAVRRRWISGADTVVVHGDALVDELPGWMRHGRVAVIPHGTFVRAEPLPPPPHPQVLLFGRLEPYKGVDVLLRAMARVWAERPETALRIAGVGPAAELVPEHPRIELRGEYVPEEELEGLFADASLAVLPYVQASQTGVGSLAVGYGVPTIVSDVGALRDVVLDDSFVAAPGDDEALALAILRHLDHDVGVRRSVLDLARREISWETSARLSLQLYESLLSGGPE
jgi:glycosyltransferase involved in cell wall biosynthesis